MNARGPRLAVLCAGQGAQAGLDFAPLRPTQHDDPRARQLWEATGAPEGRDWLDTWNGLSAGERRSNRYAQRAVVLWQLLRWLRVRGKLPTPSWVIGYSAGELTAHVIAGSLDALDAPLLVARRAAAMDAAMAGQGAGPALVLLGALPPATQALRCAALRRHSLALAIRRSPAEQVWGGSPTDVAAFLAEARSAGWPATVIDVAVPSHTPWMAAAQPAWRAALAEVPVRSPACGVLAGIDARPVRSADAVRDSLVRQIAQALAWQDCLAALAEHGVTMLLDLGPGDDQTRLATAALPQATLLDWVALAGRGDP